MFKKVTKKLDNSPINYFSDLFVVAVVLIWIIVEIIMIIMSIYTTIMYLDTSLWQYVTEIAVAPITAGIGIWMVKNSVQHAIMASKNKQCQFDFPKPTDEEIELEEEIEDNQG